MEVIYFLIGTGVVATIVFFIAISDSNSNKKKKRIHPHQTVNG